MIGKRRGYIFAAMLVGLAEAALLFDVHHFPAGGDLPVAPDQAATGQRVETEEPNQTHALTLGRANEAPLLSLRLIDRS